MALFIPPAAFYVFVFSVILEGWPTTGLCALDEPHRMSFWFFYVAPASAVIVILGRVFPSKHRKIDWTVLAVLFLGIYLLTPRVYE